MNTLTGTDLGEEIEGGKAGDTVLGRGGNDSLSGAGGADILIGDFEENLLTRTEDALTFAGYADTNAWKVADLPDGYTEMSQTVVTVAGAEYNLTFDIAADLGAGVVQGAVLVFWNGESLGKFEAASGLFAPISFSFVGTGDAGMLSFRSVEPEAASAINTSSPIFSYDKVVDVGGEQVTVAAFAEGQPNLYQVLNGTLVVFDPETQTYAQAGADATVVVNAVGFNIEDDLLYGIAVKDGVDALGNAVSKKDLVMIDADGLSYRIGETPYRSWTGDFDDKGNLWAFETDMDYFMRVDVSERDANGNPVVERFNIPDELITDRVWDVAYHSETQTFSGVVRPDSEGAAGTLLSIDVSGAEPEFSLIDVTETVIDGVAREGLPAVTFGAAIMDADGTLYVGGNSGDHDMEDTTGSSGGFYRVEIDADTQTARLVLVADAPLAASNDGAAEPRALDPFAPVDVSSSILIRGIEMVEAPDGAATFDDYLEANACRDGLGGNQGDDVTSGQSSGDALEGGTGDDLLHGGAAPDEENTGLVSAYGEDGLRYDLDANLLEEDDDVLVGGEGNDTLDGSAGHDVLDGGSGDDVLNGGSGADSLDGGLGNDDLEGGREKDLLFGSDGVDQLDGGSGDDTLDGGAGDDLIKGGSGSDIAYGGDGNDVIRGDKGKDIIEGGHGDDRLNGGSDADHLSGGDDKDFLNGGSGNDVLDGGEGKDRIYLGAGDDIASGGAGSDRFVFRSEDLAGGMDLIPDFRNDGAEADRIDVKSLDLLEGLIEEEWLRAHVSLADDGSVTADLDGCSLTFASREDGAGDAIYRENCDAFLF